MALAKRASNSRDELTGNHGVPTASGLSEDVRSVLRFGKAKHRDKASYKI